MSDFTAALIARFGDRVTLSPAQREQHGRDASFHPGAPPDAVLFAADTDDVVAATALCRDFRRPLIPYGAGSSLEGHVAAVRGGLTVSLAAMDRVLSVSAEDMDCRVEAGVTREQLNLALRDQGLFFPVDPGANATLGGMAATGASGTNAVRYGTMREVVRGLTVVLADGSVVRTGGRARKSSAGYDLTRLMIGSEGTLGIITEVQLRLSGIPEGVAVGIAGFADMRGAVEAVTLVLQSGLAVARVEFLDETQVAACNRYSHLALPVRPTLFFEFHGGPAALAETTASAAAIVAGCGGGGIEWATEAEQRSRLWKARHDALWAARALQPGAEALTTDVCVPISALADDVVAARADLDARGLTGTIVGHVGDGNFHVIVLLDPADPRELDRVEAFNAALVERALASGGTCTGEHGVGLGKKHALTLEHGNALPMMRTIKAALDPLGILNPGKIFDPA